MIYDGENEIFRRLSPTHLGRVRHQARERGQEESWEREWVSDGWQSQREDKTEQPGRTNGGVDGDRLIGKWIGDKNPPQLGAKIRIPSVLNEIFKHTLVRGGILLKGWMWKNVWNNDRLFTSARVSAHPDWYSAPGIGARLVPGANVLMNLWGAGSSRNKLICLEACFYKGNDSVNGWLYIDHTESRLVLISLVSAITARSDPQSVVSSRGDCCFGCWWNFESRQKVKERQKSELQGSGCGTGSGFIRREATGGQDSRLLGPGRSS